MLTLYVHRGIRLSNEQARWLDQLHAAGITTKATDTIPELSAEAPDMHTAWLLPLDHCPVTMPESLGIAALSPRNDARIGLCIPSSWRNEGQRPPFGEGGVVDADDALWRAYLREIRPDTVFGRRADAIRICRQDACEEVGGEAHFFPLNSLEFPPLAGSGILACVVNREAAAFRKALAAHHQKEVSRLSNVERGLQKRFTDEGIEVVGVHAREDAERHIQLSMAWLLPTRKDIRRRILSSTSYLGLVELAWRATDFPDAS